MNTVIIVLATNDYWKGAQTLFHCIRKYSRTSSVPRMVALGATQCRGAELLEIGIDYSSIPVNIKHFPNVAAKLFALTLQCDRIVLMDADILCVGDCSFLWSNSIGKLPFYACRDTASILYYQEIIEEIGLDPCRLFNAGTMIFHPKLLPPSFHDLIVSEILRGSLRAYDGGDQGYLNHYFQRESIEIGFLPVEYNESTDIYMPSLPDHAKRLIHFTGSNANPWSPKLASNDRRWPWVKRWQREWEESSRK